MFEQVLAHEGEEEELPISPLGETLDQRLKGLSLLGLELATGLALFLIILAVFWKKKTEKAKWFLYLGIALPIVLARRFSGLGLRERTRSDRSGRNRQPSWLSCFPRTRRRPDPR